MRRSGRTEPSSSARLPHHLDAADGAHRTNRHRRPCSRAPDHQNAIDDRLRHRWSVAAFQFSNIRRFFGGQFSMSPGGQFRMSLDRCHGSVSAAPSDRRISTAARRASVAVSRWFTWARPRLISCSSRARRCSIVSRRSSASRSIVMLCPRRAVAELGRAGHDRRLVGRGRRPGSPLAGRSRAALQQERRRLRLFAAGPGTPRPAGSLWGWCGDSAADECLGALVMPDTPMSSPGRTRVLRYDGGVRGARHHRPCLSPGCGARAPGRSARRDYRSPALRSSHDARAALTPGRVRVPAAVLRSSSVRFWRHSNRTDRATATATGRRSPSTARH